MYLGILGLIAFSLLTAILVKIAKSYKLSSSAAFALGACVSTLAIVALLFAFPDNAELLIYDDGEYDYLTLFIVIVIPLGMGYEVVSLSSKGGKGT